LQFSLLRGGKFTISKVIYHERHISAVLSEEAQRLKVSFHQGS